MANVGERETILEHLKTVCEYVPDAQLVSRDYGLVITGQISESNAIFIVDLGDKLDDVESSGRDNENTMTVGIVFVYEGSSREDAPMELAWFEREGLRELFTHVFECAEVSTFKKTGMSHLNWSKVNPNQVHQGIQFEIQYIESIKDLLDEHTAGTSPSLG